MRTPQSFITFHEGVQLLLSGCLVQTSKGQAWKSGTKYVSVTPDRFPSEIESTHDTAAAAILAISPEVKALHAAAITAELTGFNRFASALRQLIARRQK